MADLPPRVLWGGDREVVGQPPPGELGGVGLLIQAGTTETEGVIHGGALGAEHCERIDQAGGFLGIAAGEDGLAPIVELDDERPRRFGAAAALDTTGVTISRLERGIQHNSELARRYEEWLKTASWHP